ncbi:MAG: hypothetical protein M3357_17565 [Actinomycetota bacterium]|nr:hypothetical protein [Actinomycetota bacterium]
MDQQRSRIPPSAIGQAPPEASEAGIGHAAVVGALIGYFVVLAVVSGIVLATGAGLGVALAVGAYVAIWGGPGWGGMIGAQRYADRIADDERSAARRRPEEAPQPQPSTGQ